MHTFDTPGPVNLKVELQQGLISVLARDTTTTTVELEPLSRDSAAQELIDNARVEQRGDDIIVEVPKGKGGLFRSRGEIRATITVPTGSRAKLESSSADVKTDGELGDTSVASGSGDVLVRRVDHGRLKAKTGSGDITVGVADGTAAYLDISTVTGDVTSSLDASEAPSEGDQTVELVIQSGTGDVVLQRA